MKLFISFALLVAALNTFAAAPSPQVTFMVGNPSVVSVPPEALIGEDFTFTVTFSNAGGMGYGPFIDLVFDAGGANMTKPPSCACDGLTFVSAKVLGLNGGPVSFATFPVSANCNPLPATVPLTHPFASNGVLPVIARAGGQLVTIQLPFGSYDSTQPPVAVEVTAHVSNYADEGVPLHISARGGFQYGADALNNAPPDWPFVSDVVLGAPPANQQTNSAMWHPANQQASTTPRVMIIKKECSAPEDETVTGPNFPQTYTIKVDIADGQSIAKLHVQDILPNNVQYVGNVAVTIPSGPANGGSTCTAGVDYVLTPPSTTSAGGTLDVAFCNPITGSPNPPDDVTVTFTFYIPENDANGNLVLPNCNASVLSINKIHAEGDWTPLDPCDTSPPPPLHVMSTVAIAHKLHDRCIAAQKKVNLFTDTNATGPTPDDTLQYVIDFQVSDYKTFDQITITDFLSDGQAVTNVPAPPTLTMIGDQFPNSPYTNVILGSNFTATPDPNILCPPVLGGVKGGTRLVINVSGALIAAAGSTGNPRHKLGILTGGWAAFPPSSTTPARGQIVFYAKIQDQFVYSHLPGNKSVDKDDPLNDCVRFLNGRICTNKPVPQIPPGTGPTAQDDSMTAIAVVTDTIKKSINAIKRGGNFICGGTNSTPCLPPPAAPDVHPGDEITFRIEKTIPSSDAERLTITDFLPKPVFDVGDPDADGVSGPNWNGGILLIPPCTAPPPGLATACRFTPSSGPGGTDTLYWPPLPAGFPRLFVLPAQIATNSLLFGYGVSFNDPFNLPRTIDLLFTDTVTYKPFPDGLYLTNEAKECENNTFNVTFCQTAVAQVKLREPNLRIRKGVIATDNPHGVFSPPGPPATSNLATAPAPSGVTFNLNGFTGGPITSASQIDSNLSNVDANDLVTFAIVIENQGGHPAYDVKLTDTIPSCLTNVTAPIVKDGTGAILPTSSFTITPPTSTFTFSLTPTASIPASATNGTNIIVITFQAQIISSVPPGCCNNVAAITHYASEHLGPDFVTSGFTPPFQDSAAICVNPTLTKSVVATSEAHTAPQTSTTPQTPANTPQVAIGEIVRYRLTVLLPEGGPLSNFNVTDALPAGMKFMNDGSARLGFVADGQGGSVFMTQSFGLTYNFVGNETILPFLAFNSSQGVPALNIAGGATCGAPVTFKLNTIQNNDNDTDLEFVVIEFNALVCNVASNTNGTTLPNTFSVSVNGNQIATSIPINVVVVEPKLDVQKTYTPPSPTSAGYFTVTVTNTGTADAFDVHLTDILPSGLTLSTSQVASATAFPGGCAAPTLNIATASGVTTLAVDAPRIPVSPSCTVTLKFWVQGQFCGTNTAQVTYSSLPGGLNSHPLVIPVGTHPNGTGSTTPCSNSSTHDDCERIYTGSGQVSNSTGCCAPRPPGMVAWWPMDWQGTVINDIALPPGSMVNNIGQAPAHQSVVGKVGGATGALYFGPAPVTVPPQSPAELDFGQKDFSIDAWIRIVSVPPGVVISPIVDKIGGPSAPGFAFYVKNQGLALNVNGSTSVSSAPPMLFANPVANTGPWYHVAVTVQRNPAQAIFYINGLQAGTSAAVPAASVNTTKDLLIGGSRLVPPSTPLGQIAIDELEIFNRVLTPAEILSIVNADAAGKCQP